MRTLAYFDGMTIVADPDHLPFVVDWLSGEFYTLSPSEHLEVTGDPACPAFVEVLPGRQVGHPL
jgi:hypothetical protein